MTVDHREEPHREGNGRRIALVRTPYLTRGGSEPVDLEALCRSVAELARTGPEPPCRIRLEHLGTAVEVDWPVTAGPAAAPTAPAAAPVPPPEPGEPEGPHQVRAPMVGTFYHAPEPGAPPFVSIGDTVVSGQQVGILEVMKMMSAVEADLAGTVLEFLAPDGGPVEFQQPLIAVQPADGR